MTTAAVVVAAGSGARLGRRGPKGLVQLAGEALFVHSARTLGACSSVDEVVVVVAGPDLARAQDAARASGLRVRFCAGGATRGDSVAAGLTACDGRADVVAVHDAARPLLSQELVTRVLGDLRPPWDAVAPAVPVVDTLKAADDGRVLRTVSREGVWAVQTPQVFALPLLRRLHEVGAGPVTDDLALVEQTGGSVRLVPGERRNFKITFPEDLDMAEALLS